MNHKQLVAGLVLGAGALTAMAQTDPLRFDPSKFTNGSITMPDGQEVTYKAYEGIFYVKNVEDPTYQTFNIYVP